jgi:hypothetical protein
MNSLGMHEPATLMHPNRVVQPLEDLVGLPG